MINRLMDLVLLLVEFNLIEGDSRSNVGEELILRGYSSEEIERALLWICTKNASGNRLPEDESASYYRSTGLRVLSDWERLSLGEESHGYLLRLLNLGIVDENQMEIILAHLPPFLHEKKDLQEIKAIVCSVIFSANLDDGEEDGFKELDENIVVT